MLGLSDTFLRKKISSITLKIKHKMYLITCRISLFALYFLCSTTIFASTPIHLTEIDTGFIQGYVRNVASEKKVIEYRGIPYAKNPTGLLRWSLPQPALPWKGIFDAKEFGPACPQVSRYNLTDSSIEEDCLSINVSSPADIRMGEKLPVFFWIHGGAFVGGASNLYRLDKLASEGRMVVVSANYRLGVLGFVPLPGLANEAVNGNFGIEDQREALRWIKRNISSFGGNPDNVTLSGESAGGASVCLHLSSPDQVKGLFHQAMIISAGCLAPLKTTPEAINTIGKVITKNLGCPENEDLKCLRSKSVAEILIAQTKFADEHPTDLALYAPTSGTPSHPNSTIPTSVADALNRVNGGKFSTIPLVIGGMEKELLLYVGYWWQDALAGKGPSLDNKTINSLWLKNFYGPHANAVAIKYGFTHPKVGAHKLGEALSDFNPKLGINNCLFYRTADKIINYPSAQPTYLFEFADPNALVKGVGIMPPYPDFPLGPVHSTIINYLFPNFSNNKKINAPDLIPSSQALAHQITQYLSAFASTGQPKVSNSLVWPAYKNSGDVFKFAPGKVGPFNGGEAHNCNWWKTLYPNP